MKAAKKIMAAMLALTMAAGISACGKKDGGTDSASSARAGKDLNDDQKQIVDSLASQLPDRELANKEIQWMAHYDINPVDGKVKSPSLQLFETKYGGKITFRSSSWNTRYTDLATAVMGNTSPDFFPADDMDTFPKGAIKKMFQPIDQYVDLDSDLWADSKSYSDAFMFQGEHYIAVINPMPTFACIYSKTTIEDNGYDDPAKLFAEGKWNWDTFTEMCKDFVNAEEDKYALDGYFYNQALNDTCGVPLIGMKDGKVVNNMSDPAVEKVQDMMYNLQKDGVVYPRSENNWAPRGGSDANGEGIGSGLTLFYPIGLYAIECDPADYVRFGDIANGDVMFVPMPTDPDSDTYYVSARVHGYCICYGAPNPEGVAAFLDCEKLTTKDESVQQITYDTLKNEYLWTDEMIEMRKTLYKMAEEHPVFDVQDGVSPDLSSVMETVKQATMISGGGETTWGACREEHEGEVDFYVNEANTSVSDVPTAD